MMRKRILIFTHDGRGLGHLRRLSRIAKALQKNHSVLMIAGHRAASWIVPPECEFIHLPSLDSVDPKRARRWKRAPFMEGGLEEGLELRRAIVEATIEAFEPDAMILDYLPMGHHEEMFEILSNDTRARKYFVLRGVLDRPEEVSKTIFPRKALWLLEHKYDRIFVACDPKIIDVGGEYDLPSGVRDKLQYVGYVAEPVSARQRKETRSQRGIPEGAKWVVCSAGGGNNGFEMMNTLYELSPSFENVYFDFVLGPRSTVQAIGSQWLLGGRVRVVNEDPYLGFMHAACDVMVSFGGYNSLVEGITGGAQMIVYPFPGDFEQEEHTQRLSQFRDLTLLRSLPDLPRVLRDRLSRPGMEEFPLSLAMDGAVNIAQEIHLDLEAMSKGNSEEQVR